MDYWPTLTLIENILRDNQAAGENPQLIVCMHPEIDAEIALLTAALQRYDGQMFYLSADNDWVDPPGPLNKDSWAFVSGIIESVPNALPDDAVLEPQIVDDRVVVSIVGRDGQPVELSLKPILRAAAVLASAAFETSDITALAVNLFATDEWRRELLWRLLTPQLQHTAIVGHRTVVSILSEDTDPDRDYGRAVHLQYVSLQDRVLKRVENLDARPLSVLKNEPGPVVLFLGAGASVSAGIELGNVYRTIALRDLLGDVESTQTLEDRFFDYLQARNRFRNEERSQRARFAEDLTLERVLRETFFELGARSRDQSVIIGAIARDAEKALQVRKRGRQALQELITSRHGKLIVMTVNFDQLIETGIEDHVQVLSTPEEFEAGLPAISAYLAGDASIPVPVLKLHGSIERPETLIATIDSTAPGLDAPVRAVLDAILEVTTEPTPWIWIGCSMRDLDVNDWVRGHANDALDQWWVDPFPGASIDRFITESRFAKQWEDENRLHQRLIIESADRFLVRLRDHLTG
jgi:hypothetical protein